MHLANFEEPWLLILDSADKCDDVDYSRYMPSEGTIIITSRDAKLRRYQTIGYYELQGLDEKNAIDLFSKSAGLTMPSVDSNERRNAEELIVGLLCCHPLAILQAGAYIGSGESTLDEYLCLLRAYEENDDIRQRREEALRVFDSQERSRYECVFDTFDISTNALKVKDTDRRGAAQVKVDAVCLLGILANLHYNAIDTMLFYSAWRVAGQLSERQSKTKNWISLTTWHRDRLPALLNIKSYPWDSRRLERAIDKLVSLALVGSDASDETFQEIFVHPLIHSWMRIRLDSVGRDETWLQTGALLAYGQSVYHDQILIMQFQLHNLSFLREGVEVCFKRGTPKHVVPILYRCCCGLLAARSEQQLLKVIDAVLMHFGEDETTFSQLFPMHKLKCQCLIGVKLYQAAIVKLQAMMKYCSQIGDSFPEAPLELQNHLAEAYCKSGRYLEAAELFTQMFRIAHNLPFNWGDEIRLKTQQLFAVVVAAAGQAQDAVEILERVIPEMEWRVSADHPAFFQVQEDLARAYLQNAQTQEAVDLLRHLVAQREMLVEGHPDRNLSQHLLALACLRNGQSEDAITLYQQMGQNLPENHSRRCYTEQHRAIAYLVDGQHQASIALLQKRVCVAEKLPHNHTDRLVLLGNLAGAYRHIGRTQDAVEILQQASGMATKVLRKDSPCRRAFLAGLCQVAVTLKSCGQLQAAIPLFEWAREVQGELAGSDLRRRNYHWGLADLMDAYEKSGRYDDQVQCLLWVDDMEMRLMRSLAADGPYYRLHEHFSKKGSSRMKSQISESFKVFGPDFDIFNRPKRIELRSLELDWHMVLNILRTDTLNPDREVSEGRRKLLEIQNRVVLLHPEGTLSRIVWDLKVKAILMYPWVYVPWVKCERCGRLMDREGEVYEHHVW